jgi:uncharacterized protein
MAYIEYWPGEQRLSRREFLREVARWTVRMAAAGAGSYSYAQVIEPAWVEVSPVRLALPRLAPQFHGYRIAQISDIHMGDWMDRSRFSEIVALANSHAPDLVAITGDFVTHQSPEAAHDLITTLKGLRARDGVVAVLGNHDHWSGPEPIRRVIDESGLINVSNGVHTIERGGVLLHMAGVDDHWMRQDRLDLVLNRLPSTGAAILLAHEPDFADNSAATGRFDLQISGHSHGGQVVPPFAGPIRLPPLARKYPSGLYRVGEMFQYTNRGVGMVRPHFRFNCRPEITLFTLSSVLAPGS